MWSPEAQPMLNLSLLVTRSNAELGGVAAETLTPDAPGGIPEAVSKCGEAIIPYPTAGVTVFVCERIKPILPDRTH